MQNWLKKLQNALVDEHPADIPRRWVDRLSELLEPLDRVKGSKGRNGLAADIRRYARVRTAGWSGKRCWRSVNGL